MKLLKAGFNLITGARRVLISPMQKSLSKLPFLPKRFQSSGDSGMGMEGKGKVAAKNPAKIHLEAGKVYQWCACGLSGKQPFCDGSHKNSPLGLKPTGFKAPETKEYFFCNCKQTNKGPLCDGTHKKI